MRIISRKKLLQAIREHPELAAPLDTWYRIARRAVWASLSEVRQTFSSADQYGDCTIFNIKGNRFRLIVWINYRTQKVFLKHVLTHAEYDKGFWKDDCNSHRG